MPRFFICQTAGCGDTIELLGDDARHIGGSLRMKVGQSVTLCGSDGSEYGCIIERITAKSVCVRVEHINACNSEPSVKVNLFVALSKGDKFETVLQKSVELGVFSITPFMSDRCVSRPSASAYAEKQKRYRKIIEQAAKQCGRGIIPELMPLCGFEQACKSASASDVPILLYENETDNHLYSVLSGRDFNSVALMTGPEGGFSPFEAQTAQNSGLLSVTLGRRILRCETAPLAALAAVMYHSGNF